MIDSYAFLGLPFDFNGLCKIYPPRVLDILNEQNYPIYKKFFFNSQEDLEDEYVEKKLPMEELPTPFEYLFRIAAADSRLKQIIIKGFEFFIHESVILLMDQKMVIIGDLQDVLPHATSIDDLRILKEEDFFDFQNALRRSVGEKQIEPYNPDENPKVKYFKAKARLRDRVKAKSKDGLTLGSTLAAICCMGLGITPLNIGELSQAATSVIVRYYQEKLKYDIDIRALIGGADSKKIKPQYWIRNIEDL